MNFRKIAAASKGHLLLRYFTEDTPEPIHPAPLDGAGRQLEEGRPGDMAGRHARTGG